jgi:eukaryotic-like serine/threonine-protein kinase
MQINGKIIKNYSVGEKIWQGATSTIYYAVASNGKFYPQSVAAIKILHPYRNSPQQIKQFLNEARLLKKLNHPNIIDIYQADYTDNMYFIFLEYINGLNLRFLARKEELTADRITHIFLKLLEAVEYIHSRKIVHNDIKPENILVGSDYKTVKLIDFGYAATLGLWQKKTGASGGTEKYIAPERKQGITDFRSDIYSIGVLMEEYLLEYYKDEKIYLIITRAIQKEPIRRYQSITQLLADFRAYLQKNDFSNDNRYNFRYSRES